jgi:drug/metabolite transporter (DMT)-like permease
MTKNLTSDERRGALFSLLAVVFFAANILLLKALNVHAQAVDGWVGTLARGAVGLAILVVIFRGSHRLQWRSLFTHPLLLVRGIVGATTIAILYLTVDQLGAGRALILNLT